MGTQLNSAAEFQAKQLIAEHKLDADLESFDHFGGADVDLKNGHIDRRFPRKEAAAHAAAMLARTGRSRTFLREVLRL